ncbi:MAG: hypothetical protein BYD32DRAFT_224449 [Podila humilis]|nr:MAG: hypothetical protein BYD32DRAFT_224449 [Podila humilis]
MIVLYVLVMAFVWVTGVWWLNMSVEVKEGWESCLMKRTFILFCQKDNITQIVLLVVSSGIWDMDECIDPFVPCPIQPCQQEPLSTLSMASYLIASYTCGCTVNCCHSHPLFSVRMDGAMVAMVGKKKRKQKNGNGGCVFVHHF